MGTAEKMVQPTFGYQIEVSNFGEVDFGDDYLGYRHSLPVAMESSQLLLLQFHPQLFGLPASLGMFEDSNGRNKHHEQYGCQQKEQD